MSALVDISSTAIVPYKSPTYCFRESEDERFESVLSTISIDEIRKNAIRRRYLQLLYEFRRRCFYYSIFYHVGHLIITVGSLIVPALISVQYNQTNDNSAIFNWLTWTLSLLVTTFNGVLLLLKIDKKYYFLHTTLERLRSEGWQYLELTGRYSGVLTHSPPTHENQYRYFCHYVEKLKLKQIEEEYYKYEDATNVMNHTPAPIKPTETPLFPPSIDKELSSLVAPQSMKEALQGLVAKNQASTDAFVPKNIVIEE
uniref:Uncharacterized protein n=1 Tax=viral metagenome TaxID=1070528 RepID=A0A6C0AP58_9ZZZZ